MYFMLKNMVMTIKCTMMVLMLMISSIMQISGSIMHYRSHFTHVLDDMHTTRAVQGLTMPISIRSASLQPCSPENKASKGICVSFVQCPARVIETNKFSSCSLPSGQAGVCCTTGQNHTDVHAKTARTGYYSPTAHELEKIVYRSHMKMRQLAARIAHMIAVPSPHQMILERGTPSFGHFQGQRPMGSNFGWETSQGAMEMTFATQGLKDSNGMTNRQLELGLLNADLRGTGLGDVCVPDPVCPPARYRNLDGTCNNLLRPRWGSASGPMERLLPPSYSDGIWSVRKSVVNGQELPNARYISSRVFEDHNNPHSHFTLMLMQFGQFITHDLTLSPSTKHSNGSGISCCDHGGSELPEEFSHFACYPIIIPEDDPFYAGYGQRCMNLVRSMLAPRYDCTLGYAQQMNQVSHYIDGSMLYGIDPELTDELRAFRGGRMQMFTDFRRDLLPLTDDPEACLTMERGSACFKAGDSRVNQQVTLVVLHLLFTREHNRIANELSMLNPRWSDDLLFQETRRIVIAELQNILYAEWLPLVIGEKAMQDFGIGVRYNSYSSDYDVDVNPSITNEFSVAAFRFGHSTVDGHLRIMKQGHIDEVILMPEVMFDPSKMRSTEFYDRLTMTLANQPMQNVDPSLSDSLNRYMFRSGNPFGVDLGSINIQRGRDHGVAPYNAYRELLGLPRARQFEDFRDLMDDDAVAAIRSVYAAPDDVDLFVGGLHEKHAPGAAVGPTFMGIIADQFSRLRRGDRFFYEHGGHDHSFTMEQLREIKKVTLSRIICDNTDRIELQHIAPNSFVRSDQPGNERVHCNDPNIPSMNLRFWQEAQF